MKEETKWEFITLGLGVLGMLIVGGLFWEPPFGNSSVSSNATSNIVRVYGEIGSECENLALAIARDYLDRIGENGILRNWPEGRPEGGALKIDCTHAKAIYVLRCKVKDGYRKAFTTAASFDSLCRRTLDNIDLLSLHLQSIEGIYEDAQDNKRSSDECFSQLNKELVAVRKDVSELKTELKLSDVETSIILTKQWPGLTSAQAFELEAFFRANPEGARDKLKKMVAARVDELIHEKGQEPTRARRCEWYANNASTRRLFKGELNDWEMGYVPKPAVKEASKKD